MSMWDPNELPPGQAQLIAAELQWRPTTDGDLKSRRLEHRVGFIDRPDHRVAGFENADDFASVIAEEIASIAAGASRDALDEFSDDFSRLMARAISTWIENVSEHAFDFDALERSARLRAVARRSQASLLVTLTRGGGSLSTDARPSQNRVRLTVRDNGVSIPSTVRGHGRFGGLEDSRAIMAHLLTATVGADGRSDLKGLGYPELLDLADACAALGWAISFELVTQHGDVPGDTLVAVTDLASAVLAQDSREPHVERIEDVPFTGTTATFTVSIPGTPDWLRGLGSG